MQLQRKQMHLPLVLTFFLTACLAVHDGAFAEEATADVRSRFVRLGPGVPGVLYEPVAGGDRSGVAVLVMHPGGDYLEFSAGNELARRGYRVLCANASTAKSGIGNDVGIEQLLSEVKLGVEYLRALPGVRKVVLFGHSGGGALMSAYQNIAENGPAIGQGPEKLLPCSDRLAGLPPADGIILIDANYGLGTMVLFSLDPAVVDETSGLAVNAALDLLNPDNGFRSGGSTYPPEFIAAFQNGIAQRMTRLIDAALVRLKAIEAGYGRFQDDEPMVIPDASYLGMNNKLFAQDTSLLSHTQKPWPLLRKDGAVTQIIHTVRKPKNERTQTGLAGGALNTTVRTFLSTYAVRVDPDFAYGGDFIRGVDWRSSLACPIGNVQTIAAPLLAMGMTGNWEYLAAEMIYEHAASSDKSIAFVEGATHVFTPSRESESFPGEFGDTVKTTYDHIAQWLAASGRFY